jgi:hypothetical protein
VGIRASKAREADTIPDLRDSLQDRVFTRRQTEAEDNTLYGTKGKLQEMPVSRSHITIKSRRSISG